jgi:hypothetical protein
VKEIEKESEKKGEKIEEEWYIAELGFKPTDD